MTPPSHIIWDWNGTLVNDAPVSYLVHSEMLSRRKLAPITFQRYQEIYEHPVQRIYERSGFDFTKESLENVAHEWHAIYAERMPQIKLQDDSLAALKRAKAKNISQVILSALPHKILCQSLKAQGIGSYFTYVSGLDDQLARSKIENGHRLLKETGAIAEKTIMIGDSSHDIETAQALGIKCHLVGRGFEDKARLLSHGQNVFDDFGQLFDYLKF